MTISAAIGLTASIVLMQAVAEHPPGTSATISSRVWKTVEFAPADTKSHTSPSTPKLFSLRRFKSREQTGGQTGLKVCTKMPMVTVDPSVDSKIILPRSLNGPKPHVRMVGEEMAVCENR